MIFCYTGTGNTKAVVAQMRSELGETLAGDLVSITECVKEGKYEFQLEEGEGLGIAVPVYFFGIPASAKAFLERVKLTFGGTRKVTGPVFLVVTFGGTTGGACEMMEAILAKKGIETGYKTAIKIFSNYSVLYDVPPRAKQEALWEEARRSVSRFTQAIREGKVGDYNHDKGPVPKLSTPVVYGLYGSQGMKTNQFMSEESCTGCGLCEKLCPVDAIAMRNGKPVWTKERCDRCLACYHHCPANAIQMGTKTKGKRQYVCPGHSESDGEIDCEKTSDM